MSRNTNPSSSSSSFESFSLERSPQEKTVVLFMLQYALAKKLSDNLIQTLTSLCDPSSLPLVRRLAIFHTLEESVNSDNPQLFRSAAQLFLEEFRKDIEDTSISSFPRDIYHSLCIQTILQPLRSNPPAISLSFNMLSSVLGASAPPLAGMDRETQTQIFDHISSYLVRINANNPGDRESTAQINFLFSFYPIRLLREKCALFLSSLQKELGPTLFEVVISDIEKGVYKPQVPFLKEASLFLRPQQDQEDAPHRRHAVNNISERVDVPTGLTAAAGGDARAEPATAPRPPPTRPIPIVLPSFPRVGEENHENVSLLSRLRNFTDTLEKLNVNTTVRSTNSSSSSSSSSATTGQPDSQVPPSSHFHNIVKERIAFMRSFNLSTAPAPSSPTRRESIRYSLGDENRPSASSSAAASVQATYDLLRAPEIAPLPPPLAQEFRKNMPQSSSSSSSSSTAPNTTTTTTGATSSSSTGPAAATSEPSGALDAASSASRSGNAPAPKRRRWTEDETKRLMQGVQQWGPGKWEAIRLSANLEGRSSVDIKDKYRNMERAKLI